MGQYGCGLAAVGPAGSPMRHNGGPAPASLRLRGARRRATDALDRYCVIAQAGRRPVAVRHSGRQRLAQLDRANSPTKHEA